MKFTSIIYATLMAAVTVQAAAPAQTTDINVLSADEVCNLPGHPCNKMKRAAEAAAEAMAEPEAVAGRASLINLLESTMLTWSTLDPKGGTGSTSVTGGVRLAPRPSVTLWRLQRLLRKLMHLPTLSLSPRPKPVSIVFIDFLTSRIPMSLF